MSYKPLEFNFSEDFMEDEIGEALTMSFLELPEIDAYNSDTGRLPRLWAAWGAASTTVKLLSARYQNQWPGAIISMHDHKGTLQIVWRDKQSRILFEGVIMGAWERQGEHAGSHDLSR